MKKLIILAVAVAAAVFIIRQFFPGLKTVLRKSMTAMRMSTLPRGEYIVISNFDVPSSKGSIAVDYAVVSPYGVFVILEKPIGGRVYGKGTDERWTRMVGRKESTVRNPLFRLKAQVVALSRYLELEPGAFIPVVLLSGGGASWVKTQVPIVSGTQLKSRIYEYKEKRLDINRVQDISIRLGEL